jgi:Protein of unknown function (DUF2911)
MKTLWQSGERRNTMLRLVVCTVLLGAMVNVGLAEQASANTATATCSFQDGKQISVRYHQVTVGKNGLPEGEVWTPGGGPMFLFTPADLVIGNSEIPIGAYSMYVIPKRENWTLVLNKNVSEGSKYDEHQDLLRVDMQVGQLSEPNKQLSVFFGHIAPRQCNMRIYYGKTGTWAEFKEK